MWRMNLSCNTLQADTTYNLYGCDNGRLFLRGVSCVQPWSYSRYTWFDVHQLLGGSIHGIYFRCVLHPTTLRLVLVIMCIHILYSGNIWWVQILVDLTKTFFLGFKFGRFCVQDLSCKVCGTSRQISVQGVRSPSHIEDFLGWGWLKVSGFLLLPPQAHKAAVVCTVMSRAQSLPSSVLAWTDEEVRVATALQSNSYPLKFIRTSSTLTGAVPDDDATQTSSSNILMCTLRVCQKLSDES